VRKIVFLLTSIFLTFIFFIPNFAETKKINFIGVNNNYPYMYYDKNGTATGLIVDIFNEIAKKNNYEVNYILTSPNNLISLFEEKGDIMFHDNYINSADYSYKDSIPFLTIRNHVFAYKTYKEILNLKSYNNHSNIEKTLKNRYVGVKNKTLSTNMALIYTNENHLIRFDNYSEGLKLLKSKKIDLIIMPETVGKALIYSEKYNDLLISKNHIFLENYYFTVKTKNLLSSLNTSILQIQKTSKLSDLNSKWIYDIKLSHENFKYLKYFNAFVFVTIMFILYLMYKNNNFKISIEKNKIELNEQKEKNEELLKQLLKHEKLKNDHFINLSHELRTPLNVILGLTQLTDSYIKKQNYSKLIENAENYNSVIKTNSYRLLKVINNIIDINKFDINEYHLNIDFIDVIFVLEEIINSTKQYIKLKKLNLHFETDIEEKIIECDPFEIDRVFMNLLSNAIKFSKPNGDIWIKVHDELNGVKIIFKDNGIGISKEKQKIIFDSFTQIESSLNREHEGNGIGLYLVKSIITLHGGEINIESEENIGTTFTIFLPTKSNYGFKTYANSISDFNQKYYVDLEFSDILNEHLNNFSPHK